MFLHNNVQSLYTQLFFSFVTMTEVRLLNERSTYILVLLVKVMMMVVLVAIVVLVVSVVTWW